RNTRVDGISIYRVGGTLTLAILLQQDVPMGNKLTGGINCLLKIPSRIIAQIENDAGGAQFLYLFQGCFELISHTCCELNDLNMCYVVLGDIVQDDIWYGDLCSNHFDGQRLLGRGTLHGNSYAGTRFSLNKGANGINVFANNTVTIN